MILLRLVLCFYLGFWWVKLLLAGSFLRMVATLIWGMVGRGWVLLSTYFVFGFGIGFWVLKTVWGEINCGGS